MRGLQPRSTILNPPAKASVKFNPGLAFIRWVEQ